MYCINCDLSTPDDSIFCENCGKPVKQVPEIHLIGSSIPNTPFTLLLPTLFRTNAFHILGLDTGIDPKTIQKRGKEITTRLKIDDIPEYNLDFEKADLFRNESAVKVALQKVNSPKDSIGEYFFWFDINPDSTNQEILDAIKNAEYSKALSLFQNSTESIEGISFSQRRNLAVFYSVLLCNKNFKSCLIPSVNLWNTLMGSPVSWDEFFRFYTEKTGFILDQVIINEFKKQAVSQLSDFYAEISNQLNDSDYLLEYKERFSVTGNKTEKDVINPVLQKIHTYIEELKKIEISSGNKNDATLLHKIDAIIEKILDEIDVLSSFGLDEDSRVKASRDEAAKAIRELSIPIHNEWNNQTSSLELINTARDICGTMGYGASLGEDLRQVQETKNNSLIINPIDDTIEHKRFAEALQMIENQENKSNNSRLVDLLKDRKMVCVTAVAIERYIRAKNAFKDGKNDEAKNNYEYTASLIYKNLELFNFNKATIDDIIQTIPSKISIAIAIRDFEILDRFRDNIIDAAKKNFEGKFEEDILIILVDSHIYPPLIRQGLISGKPSSSSSSSCFVITASMGDRHHPNVLLLQSFRDTWLIQRDWGCWCNACYEKIGPHFAEIIRGNWYLQLLSRLFIVTPSVWIAKKILK